MVAERLAQEPELQLVDVREPYEHEAGHIPDSRLIELIQLQLAGGDPAAGPPGRLLLPRGLPLADGGTGPAGGRLRGILHGRRATALGAGGPRPGSRRGPGGRPLERGGLMEASSEYAGVKRGAGWAACELEDLGDGPGFRKVRRALGVDAFGVNAIVLPAGMETGFHYHEHPGGAVLRPPRDDRDALRRRLDDHPRRGRPGTGRRRHGAPDPQRGRGRRRVSVSSAARAATSGATDASRRASRTALARCTTSAAAGEPERAWPDPRRWGCGSSRG